MKVHKIETNGLKVLFRATKIMRLPPFTQFSTSSQNPKTSPNFHTITQSSSFKESNRTSFGVNRTITFQPKRLLLPDIDKIDIVSPPPKFPSIKQYTPQFNPNHIPSVIRTYRFRINSLCQTTNDVYEILDEAERNFSASPEVLAEAIKKLFYISKDMEQSLLLFNEYRFIKKDPTLLYLSFVQLHVDNNNMEKAEEIVQEMQRLGLRVPVAIFESLMYGYCKSPETIEKANEILFKRLGSAALYPSINIYSSLAYLYSKIPRPEMVQELVSIMGNVTPTVAAGMAVQLSKKGKFDDAKALLPFLKNSIDEDVLIANILVYIEEIVQIKTQEITPKLQSQLEQAMQDAERVYKFIIANDINDKRASVLMLRGYLELNQVSNIEYLLDLMSEPSEIFSYKLLHNVTILGKQKIKELAIFMEKKDKPLQIYEWWMLEKLFRVWGNDPLPIEVDLET